MDISRVNGFCALAIKPKDLVKDTGFPFPTEKSVKVKIHFTPGNTKLIVEKYQRQ